MMAYYRQNDSATSKSDLNMHNTRSFSAEYSGDERDSRSGGEDSNRPDSSLQNKPTYLLEHLATFTVNKESGIVYPADGMRRLLQLEKTTGIWSQKMRLCLDHQWVLIMDFETGNIIERFPAKLIQEPTAFTSTDAMELYNNILVFIVSGANSARSEMHIFQSQSVSAVLLVEDLKNLQNGKIITRERERERQRDSQQQSTNKSHMINSLANRLEMQQQTSHHHIHHQQLERNTNAHHMNFDLKQENANISDANGAETDSEHGGAGIGGGVGVGGGFNDEISSTSSDRYERDVTVLNHCFDDIEKFIARLQHAAAASRELERRRRNRKSKKKDPGEGLLSLRTRPPHEREFIDIFAKFKLSFNLLAKLKAHIHDPNAPELVHFLFTPLALIVEASNDAHYEAQLPNHTINPLLTREAINLLINCVTSKETELWRSLGEAWTLPRDQWKENVGSYHPVFLDGWSPDYLIVDELESSTSKHLNVYKRAHLLQHQRSMEMAGAVATGTAVLDQHGGSYDDFDGGTNAVVTERYTVHHGNTADNNSMRATDSEAVGYDESIDRNVSNVMLDSLTQGIQNLNSRGAAAAATTERARHHHTSKAFSSANACDDTAMLEAWLDELQEAGAKIVLVTYPRTANNDKELSVVRGEYLEILDDTRKWWKAKNIHGQIAHVPHTIVTPYNFGNNNNNDHGGNNSQIFQQQRSSQQVKQVADGNTAQATTSNILQNSPKTSNWVRSKHSGKKGEFRYF